MSKQESPLIQPSRFLSAAASRTAHYSYPRISALHSPLLRERKKNEESSSLFSAVITTYRRFFIFSMTRRSDIGQRTVSWLDIIANYHVLGNSCMFLVLWVTHYVSYGTRESRHVIGVSLIAESASMCAKAINRCAGENKKVHLDNEIITIIDRISIITRGGQRGGGDGVPIGTIRKRPFLSSLFPLFYHSFLFPLPRRRPAKRENEPAATTRAATAFRAALMQLGPPDNLCK